MVSSQLKQGFISVQEKGKYARNFFFNNFVHPYDKKSRENFSVLDKGFSLEK